MRLLPVRSPGYPRPGVDPLLETLEIGARSSEPRFGWGFKYGVALRFPTDLPTFL
jgi:hypothetical protein